MKVPISELPAELSETDRLAWRLPIHEGACDADRLLIDVGQVRAAARLAGLSGIIVQGYQGQASEYNTSSTSVTGMFGDGTAAGSAAVSASKAETEKSTLVDPLETSLYKNYNWPQATVDINRTELGSRIANRKKRGSDAEQAWANELDRSLRRGIVKAASHNLLSFDGSIEEMFINSIYAANQIGIGLNTQWWGIGVAGFHSAFLIIHSLVNKVELGDIRLRYKRWSFFPSEVQPDRFALAALAASFKPMVKAAKAGSLNQSETATGSVG